MKRVVLLIVALSALSVMCVEAQEDQDNYFTGTLIENTANHLKVSRVLQGKTEERVFKVNARTKVEGGRLRLRTRINVRYIADDDNTYTAILVIVRPGTTPAKKQK